jgi:dienelactone hydrolase
VIASLSTTTSKGNPLPTIVGLNWLLEQAEDPTSVYYHRLDTAHIGALGHSEGGMSTCKAASDPRISAIATVSGTSTISALHGPALFFCGGKDTVVSCDGVKKSFDTVKDQPAIFINNLSADHGGWLGQGGAKGPTIFGITAWFRVQLMGDAENRKRFYGSGCTFCADSRVKVEQNSFMTQ